MPNTNIHTSRYKGTVNVLLFAAVLLMGVSCSIFRPTGSFDHPGAVHRVEGTNQTVGPDVVPDSAVTAFLQPYQKGISGRMNEYVAEVKQPMAVEAWGGPLGNLVADMLRRRTTRYLARPVDIGFYDPQLIEGILPEGDMRVRDVYAMLPDNSRLVILEMQGSSLSRWARQLVANGRGAISGVRMQVQQNRPRDVLVGLSSIDDEATYTMATTERMAREIETWSSLTDHLSRRTLDLTLRQAFIEYMASRRTISPAADQRIRK